MAVSAKAKKIVDQLGPNTKLGDLRNIAKEIKKDHVLAMELWESESFLARQLAILIMDKKLLSSDLINKLDGGIQKHVTEEQTQLMDWLMANQLMKDKKTVALIETWRKSPSPLQRRCFWYYQGRLRWMGKIPPGDTASLLEAIESDLLQENPIVQWAMNFTAGWIGVYDAQYRSRCIALGIKTGLYKGEMVSKGCTPSYLPEFISIEAEKRGL